MINHAARNVRCAAIACAFALVPCAALRAQTNDEARLTLGISAGYIAPAKLWDVANQPIFSQFAPPDLFHITRELRSDITVSGHATYFGTPHLGVTGEFTYLGLGNSDGCTVVQDSGDLELQTVCNALSGNLGSGSVTTVSGGLVYRPLSRSFLQPYFMGIVGLAFTPSSTIAMRSVYGSIGDTSLILTVYKDDNWAAVRPSWTAAFGISTAPSSGYQLRLEARDTWLPLGEVTGPTIGQGFQPDSKTVIKSFFSVLIGFDVVLAKQRGRRY